MTPDSPQQFPLALTLDVEASFDNYWSDDSSAAVDYLQALPMNTGEHWCLLSGASGVGKTHLLQALVNVELSNGKQAIFLDCEELLEALQSMRTDDAQSNDDNEDNAEALLGSLYGYDVLVFDNVHVVATDAGLQRALFYLLVKLKQSANSKLVLSSSKAVSQLESEGLLKDLSSRLNSAVAFRLGEYSDEQKKAILIFRSERLGMQLGDDVAEFIMQRFSRDLKKLMEALKTLDALALSQKRRLTIPFVKQVLGL